MFNTKIFIAFILSAFLTCTTVTVHHIIRPEVLRPFDEYGFVGVPVGILFDTRVIPNPTVADLKKALDTNEVFNEEIARPNSQDPSTYSTIDDYDIYLVEYGNGKNPYLALDTDLIRGRDLGFGYLIKRK